MSRGELMSRAVWSAERDRNIKLAARHHEHVGRVVHDLVEGNKRKAPGHELDDRPKPGHGRADAKAGKTVFADRRIDDSSRSETFEQTLAHFVSALIFRDFLAHQKNIRVARQLFGKRFVESLTISDLPHDLSPLK